MALVEYSDSDESNTHNPSPPKGLQMLKRKRGETPQDLPPLPSTFHDLYSSTVRLSNQDDPTLHGGKERSKPHVEGQWPSHVYIEWCPSRTESTTLKRFLDNLVEAIPDSKGNAIHSLVESELGAGLPLHISLSAPMMLLTEERQAFLDAMEDGLSKSSIRPFELDVMDIDWVANFEATRWFLVLRLTKPAGNELNRLLQISNQVASNFGQPSLYSPSVQAENRATERGRVYRARSGRRRANLRGALLAPRPPPVPDQSSSFHISVAWSLKPPSEEMKGALANIGVSELAALSLHVEAVKAKIGNAISVFPLSSKAKASKGILGS